MSGTPRVSQAGDEVVVTLGPETDFHSLCAELERLLAGDERLRGSPVLVLDIGRASLTREQLIRLEETVSRQVGTRLLHVITDQVGGEDPGGGDPRPGARSGGGGAATRGGAVRDGAGAGRRWGPGAGGATARWRAGAGAGHPGPASAPAGRARAGTSRPGGPAVRERPPAGRPGGAPGGGDPAGTAAEAGQRVAPGTPGEVRVAVAPAGGDAPPARGPEPGRARAGAGVVVRRTLRSGHRLVYDGDVVILGDVNPGAEVIASGDVVVFGRLRGTVHAGVRGDEQAIVASLAMQPVQLRIAACIGRAPDDPGAVGREGRGRGAGAEPEIAFVRDGRVVIEPFDPARWFRQAGRARPLAGGDRPAPAGAAARGD